MNVYDRISNMSNINSIWWYTHRIRITYVAQGWLIIWDHQDNPPKRYDFRELKHDTVCHAATKKVHELTLKAVN